MLRVACAVPLPYVVYLVVVARAGLLGPWWDAKTVGLLRMSGAAQITGFNMPGAPSLVSRLLVQLSRFGTSYVLLGACLVVGVLAACSPHSSRRLVGFLAAGAGVLGGYAAAAGTLEEQFGYAVVSRRACSRPPSRPVTSTSAAGCGGSSRRRRRSSSSPRPSSAGSDARPTTTGSARSAPSWTARLPPGARVGLTGVTAEFALLPHPGYAVWPSLRSLADNHADYVVTQSQTLSQGYGYASPQLLPWLDAHAHPVFRFTGPSNGATVVWRLDAAAVRDAVDHGTTLPPVSGGFP